MLGDVALKMAGYLVVIALVGSYTPGGAFLFNINQKDASNDAISAYLAQWHQDKLLPVRFIGRKLSPSEQNWSIAEREGLSITWALNKFNKYLLGSVCNRTVDIAIVGAGAAGTYAAYRLRETGQKIELLEYSNRIGGRMFSTHLPNAPDVPVELGASRFLDGSHSRVQRLVQELNLSADVYQQVFHKSHKTRYFLRGTHLTPKQIGDGDVPYHLSAEERANIGNTLRFYLEKLTGFSGDVTKDHASKLKTKHGRELYKLTIQEALQLVATTEGRSYVQDSTYFEGFFMDNVTAAELLLAQNSLLQDNSTVLMFKNGMDSLAKAMAKAFLHSSDRHTVTLNRKLKAISRRTDGFYQLQLWETRTQDGVTRFNGGSEFLCARKVILAIPQLALTKLNWKPLRDPHVKEALHAVIPFAISKIYFTFPKAWWLDNPSLAAHVMKSDLLFRQMYDWKFSNVSGSYVLLASYADVSSTIHMQNINTGDWLISGSALGANKVTNSLKEELMGHLAHAFGIRRETIPEPNSAVSQFWMEYPYSGGLTMWKAGYNYNNVRNIIQHPSLLDDVYIVGADHAFLGMTRWVEGALSTVDAVLDMYFSHI